MESLTVERSIWIDAPRERVWQAVTDPEQIARWFVPEAFGAQMSRGDDGTLSVQVGPMAVRIAVFDELDPPRRAVSRPMPDDLLTTIYALDEADGGTRVTVTLAGFEALPEDARQDRLAPSGSGWEKALANLKAFIEGKAQPHPEGHSTSMFGYRRETETTIAVERSIWIDAAIDRVWSAITDPKKIAEWFSPGKEWCVTGLEVGGTLYVYDPETDSEMYTQVIDVVDPPHRFVTHSAPPEIPHVSAWSLAEEDGGTRLTITDSGYEHESPDVRHNNLEQNAFGYGMMLENLKAVIEGEPLPWAQGF